MKLLMIGRGGWIVLGLWCCCFAASAGDVWRFAVMGDTRGAGWSQPESQRWINTPVLTNMVAEILNDNPAFVIHTGDMIYELWYGSNAEPQVQYDLFKEAIEPLKAANIPLATIRGNHETYQENQGDVYLTNFGANLPTNGPPGEVGLTYSFVHNNAFFIGLDEYVHTNQVNLAWLNEQLAGNTQPHVFVFGHAPAFQVDISTTLARYPQYRDAFWNAIGRAGARIYFCGHDHFYNHGRATDANGNDVHQLLIGSGSVYLESWSGAYAEPERITLQYHNQQYHGYTLVTVSNNTVTANWKAFVNGVWTNLDTFSYTVTEPTTFGHHVKLNGGTGPLNLNAGLPILVSVQMDPGAYAGLNADWWMAAYTPMGWYGYADTQWILVADTLFPAYRGPLYSLVPTTVLSTSDLATGAYTFFFGIDINMNSVLDTDVLTYDAISLNIY